MRPFGIVALRTALAGCAAAPQPPQICGSPSLREKHRVLRQPVLAPFAVVLLALVNTMPAAAETEGDTKVAQLHQEHPELGFLFFDVTLLRDGHPSCAPRYALLVSDTGKKANVNVFTSGMLGFGAKSPGALASLEPAVWTVVLLDCVNQKFKGSVAQIRVEAGEIMNAGNLVVDVYTIRSKGFFTGALYGAHARVEDLGPETLESLNKRVPATFARAKRRYFGINPGMK
jgi:hypothetical protein